MRKEKEKEIELETIKSNKQKVPEGPFPIHHINMLARTTTSPATMFVDLGGVGLFDTTTALGMSTRASAIGVKTPELVLNTIRSVCVERCKKTIPLPLLKVQRGVEDLRPVEEGSPLPRTGGREDQLSGSHKVGSNERILT